MGWHNGAWSARRTCRYLGAWGVEFFGAVERAANHPFYAAIGKLGANFLFTENQITA